MKGPITWRYFSPGWDFSPAVDDLKEEYNLNKGSSNFNTIFAEPPEPRGQPPPPPPSLLTGEAGAALPFSHND